MKIFLRIDIIAIALLALSTSLLANKYVVDVLSKEETMQICRDAGATYNISPLVLYSIATIESGRNRFAYNSANRNGTADMGLMQINSVHLPWLRKTGLVDERRIYEPHYNAKVGAQILRKCIDQFGQSWRSIDCYNKGSKNAQEASGYVARFSSAYKRASVEWQASR